MEDYLGHVDYTPLREMKIFNKQEIMWFLEYLLMMFQMESLQSAK